MSFPVDERAASDVRARGNDSQESSQQNTMKTANLPSYESSNMQNQRVLGNLPEEDKMSRERATTAPASARTGQELDGTRQLPVRERSRTDGHSGGKPTPIRICKKCGESLTGQFVRALGGTFHLDCFRCKVGRPGIYRPISTN